LKESAFGHRLESRKFEGLFGMEESHWRHRCEMNTTCHFKYWQLGRESY
jgi:hypothetical protein